MIAKNKIRISVVIDEPEKLEFIREHLHGIYFRNTDLINCIIRHIYNDMKNNPQCYK